MMLNKKGFTLVELLLVVAILAFLVAIIAIAASNVSLDAKKRSMYASLKGVKTAIETYYVRNNFFPATGDENLYTYLIASVPIDQRLLDTIPRDIFNTIGGTPDPNLGYVVVHYSLNTTNNRTYVSWSEGPDDISDIPGAADDTIPFIGDDIFVTNAKGMVYEP